MAMDIDQAKTQLRLALARVAQENSVDLALDPGALQTALSSLRIDSDTFNVDLKGAFEAIGVLAPGGKPTDAYRQVVRTYERRHVALPSNDSDTALSKRGVVGTHPSQIHVAISADTIRAQLGAAYPGRDIFPPQGEAEEIICEVAPAVAHPEWSRAIAVFNGASKTHRHEHTTEIYRVLRGSLQVTIDGRDRILREGMEIKIVPGQVHSARSIGGQPAWVDAYSEPGWSPDDHILVV